jgi:hypothetical protein
VKKGILLLSLNLLALAAASAMDKELTLKPSMRPAGSLSDWVFENAAQVPGRRGGLDLAIASAAYAPDADTDLILHFDSPAEKPRGPYAIVSGSGYSVAEGKFGPGSVLFGGPGAELKLKPEAGALLGEKSEFRDFSIEFWIKPTDVRDGENLFSWQASKWSGNALKTQEISCTLFKGKMRWRIVNLFSPQAGGDSSYELAGRSYLVPKSWSHHLLRFDFDTGMVEYLANGVSEAIVHATSTGREDGTVYIPSVGNRGEIKIGKDYSGQMDELRISRKFVDQPQLRPYQSSGARVESPIVDLGYSGSTLKAIKAITSTASSQGIEYLARSGDSYADWDEASPAWVAFDPDRPLAVPLRGRYAQVALNLYPDGPGSSTPKLTSITLVYREFLPPPAPARVIAIAGDGEILVSWTRAPDPALKGYRVYYGEASREYFGRGSTMGASPVDVGDATSARLKGLVDGKLYFIAVSAYGPGGADQESEFSDEVSARPLRSAR